MKKITTIFACLVCLFSNVKGQNITKTDSSSKKNEVKINALYLLVPILEVSYERILNDESAIGCRVGSSFGSNTNSSDYLFEFMPYYRIYFGKKPASGFFAEVNANTFVTQDYSTYYYAYNNNTFYSTSTTKKNLNFGMGLAIGGKFLTKNKKTIVEIYGGLGRNFIKNSSSFSSYPALGINFGRRF